MIVPTLHARDVELAANKGVSHKRTGERSGPGNLAPMADIWLRTSQRLLVVGVQSRGPSAFRQWAEDHRGARREGGKEKSTA